MFGRATLCFLCLLCAMSSSLPLSVESSNTNRAGLRGLLASDIVSSNSCISNNELQFSLVKRLIVGGTVGRDICQTEFSTFNGDYASILNIAEFENALTLVRSSSNRTIESTQNPGTFIIQPVGVFIGLISNITDPTPTNSTSRFTWFDGSPLNFGSVHGETPWDSQEGGEPNNFDTDLENCVEMRAARNYSFNDDPCTAEKFLLCKHSCLLGLGDSDSSDSGSGRDILKIVLPILVVVTVTLLLLFYLREDKDKNDTFSDFTVEFDDAKNTDSKRRPSGLHQSHQSFFTQHYSIRSFQSRPSITQRLFNKSDSSKQSLTSSKFVPGASRYSITALKKYYGVTSSPKSSISENISPKEPSKESRILSEGELNKVEIKHKPSWRLSVSNRIERLKRLLRNTGPEKVELRVLADNSENFVNFPVSSTQAVKAKGRKTKKKSKPKRPQRKDKIADNLKPSSNESEKFKRIEQLGDFKSAFSNRTQASNMVTSVGSANTWRNNSEEAKSESEPESVASLHFSEI